MELIVVALALFALWSWSNVGNNKPTATPLPTTGQTTATSIGVPSGGYTPGYMPQQYSTFITNGHAPVAILATQQVTSSTPTNATIPLSGERLPTRLFNKLNPNVPSPY